MKCAANDHRYRELPAKLQKDPGLLERAMLYLRVTGEVHLTHSMRAVFAGTHIHCTRLYSYPLYSRVPVRDPTRSCATTAICTTSSSGSASSCGRSGSWTS